MLFSLSIISTLCCIIVTLLVLGTSIELFEEYTNKTKAHLNNSDAASTSSDSASSSTVYSNSNADSTTNNYKEDQEEDEKLREESSDSKKTTENNKPLKSDSPIIFANGQRIEEQHSTVTKGKAIEVEIVDGQANYGDNTPNAINEDGSQDVKDARGRQQSKTRSK